MKLNKIITVLIALITVISLSAQTSKVDKGEKYFNDYYYTKAIEKYESYDNKSTDVKRKLAESYSYVGDTKKSEVYYSQVVEANDMAPEDLYNYAAILAKNSQYVASQEWMKKYYALERSDGRAVKNTSNPGFYRMLLRDQKRFSIKNVTANSAAEDFGVSYYKDKVVFASSREGAAPIKRTWNWNGLPYLDTYIATPDDNNELSDIEEFHKEINNKYHEGPISFNKAGDYMVFTRNNYEGKSKEGIVKLQLYSAKYADEEWGEGEAIPFNSDDYSVGHASLTSEGENNVFCFRHAWRSRRSRYI